MSAVRLANEFIPSPRSSISSSTIDSTPPSSSSPDTKYLSLPAGRLFDPLAPQPTSISIHHSPHQTTAPLDRGRDGSGRGSSQLEVTSGRDFARSDDTDPLTRHTESPPLPAKAESPAQKTQLDLAEIFAGHPRPHYRSASFSQSPLASAPSPSSRSEFTDLKPTSRGYFSPPLTAPLLSRARSQSSAPAYAFPDQMPSGVSYGATGQSSAQQDSNSDQYGYRSTPIPTTTISSHYSGPLDPSIPSVQVGGMGIPSPRSPFTESRLGQIASSYNGGGYGSDSLSGGSGGVGGYDPQTGWRSSTGVTSRHSSWEDPERLGRQRDRLEDQYRPWGEREVDGASPPGIGLSNMSPFSRDGGRALVDAVPDVRGIAYRPRREYSLGAVGSGRKRGETLWGNSKPLREAETEDEEDDDAFAPPTRSGATSRRHSFATFHPLTRTTGFHLSEETVKSNGKGTSNGGFASMASASSSYLEFGTGSSAIDDDDLSADLNSLHLNLEAHAAATESTSRRLSSADIESSPSTGYIGDTTTNLPLFFQALPPPIPSAQRSMQPQFEFGTPVPAMTHDQGEFSVGGRGYLSQPPPPQAAQRYSGFGLPPPLPPTSQAFYPYNPPNPGLSAQAPPFGFSASIQPFYSPAPPTNVTAPSYVPPGQAPPTSSNASSSPDIATTSLGRGVPLHAVPANAPLYIVEFKAGRKDLFFCEDSNLHPQPGDLVIVEADRGRDIGKLLKPCSLDEVQAFQQRLVEVALGQLANPVGGGGPPTPATIAKMTKEFAPKKIFGKAQPADTQMLLSKAQDEVKVLAMVKSKVQQKNLPMQVCDAEWQWDRKKLTLYYFAESRVDFRELVRDLFRLYKSRIWMCCLDQPIASNQ